MANFLITGGAGFIGSHFVELCASRGDRVIVLDALTYAGHRENLEHIKGNWELVEGRIEDGKLVHALLRDFAIDAIFNFAAESHVDRSIDGPAPFITTNIFGTYNLLQESVKYFANKPDFRFIQVSTDEVYGDLGPTGKFSESSPYAPHSPYSASKASADLLVKAWHHTYQLPTLITNCSNNYGPRQFPEKLIPFMVRCALEGKPLGVYGSGLNVRDWIYVGDHVRGIRLAFEKGEPGETFCFGGNSERTNLDVVKQICKALDELRPRSDGKKHESAIQFVTDRLGHDRRYAINDEKAQTVLGYKHMTSDFESGLRQTVKWYLENTNWITKVLGKA